MMDNWTCPMKTTFFAGAAFLMASVAAFAQPSEDEAIDQAIACRDIVDDLERLKCLDAAAETLSVTRIIREKLAADEAQQEQDNFGLARVDRNDKDNDLEKAANKDLPILAEIEEEFGAEDIPEQRKKKEEKRLKSITAKIAEIRINPFGKVTLTLENGQVWRQLDSEGKNLRFKEGDQLYTARIKRGLIGSYRLTIPELKRTIRVNRIK